MGPQGPVSRSPERSSFPEASKISAIFRLGWSVQGRRRWTFGVCTKAGVWAGTVQQVLHRDKYSFSRHRPRQKGRSQMESQSLKVWPKTGSVHDIRWIGIHFLCPPTKSLFGWSWHASHFERRRICEISSFFVLFFKVFGFSTSAWEKCLLLVLLFGMVSMRIHLISLLVRKNLYRHNRKSFLPPQTRLYGLGLSVIYNANFHLASALFVRHTDVCTFEDLEISYWDMLAWTCDIEYDIIFRPTTTLTCPSHSGPKRSHRWCRPYPSPQWYLYFSPHSFVFFFFSSTSAAIRILL